MHSQTKIDICPKCQGEGKLIKEPEHRHDDTYIEYTCPTCEGSGRLEVTITKTVKPFKTK